MILDPITKIFSESAEFTEFISGKDIRGSSVEGISPASFPMITASIMKQKPRQILVVTESTPAMRDFIQDLEAFIDPEIIFPIPSWDTLPYESVSSTERTERERIAALFRLIAGETGIYPTTLEAVIRMLPGREHLVGRGLELSSGDEYPFEDLIDTLVQYGYSREARVEAPGQFTVKGGIIDLYQPGTDMPLRFDFFGDTLESIREFSVESQRSISAEDKAIGSISIYPRGEMILFPSEKEKLEKFLDEKHRIKNYKIKKSPERPEIDFTGSFPGIEDIFPVIIPSDLLSSYLNRDALVILLDSDKLLSKRHFLEKSFTEIYSKKHSDFFCLPPEKLINGAELDSLSSQGLTLQSILSKPGAWQWKLRGLTGFQGRIKSVREEISKRLENGWKVFVTTGFEGQARRLYDLFSEFNPGSDFTVIDQENPFNIAIAPLSSGLELLTEKILILSDHEIFGKSYRSRRTFKKKQSRPIESFIDLREGDPVVHINHGIGIFKKIERMSAGGVERDFLMLQYADGDHLYVALDQISMVQKYIGVEGRNPKLNHLGKKSSWNKIKERVREAVEEIARELMEIYSKRLSLKGYQFPPDTMWQEEFESKFEYEETPDQISAIEDVKDDMENAGAMDRLICGDVGFGKTEVAIRAAFKAVMAGRQVALLVPTTVLAMQHHRTFLNRFQDYPIEIDMISRFRTQGETKTIKSRLKQGSIDIIIGTHSLLAKSIEIKNLGLLVIDEEQKFGVRHKEQLKKLKATVDVLTLSATPIPRTLHLSLTGIRDLSTIATPPENRQAIETYVLEDNPDILRMAILREIQRDGQVFFIHNRVQTIEAQMIMLEKLVPEATFRIAHGQMHEHELEDVMIDFLQKKFDALICTTIIESGLDMPNANTIIINRADTLGLSQLYQLKGRVGRSTRQAYAYLFYPAYMPLSEEAQKRLSVISEYTELGSGLKIAMKDLEIRGAGNILGREQSGNIMEVGFELYSQMLEDSIKRLKGEQPSTPFRTPVFLRTDFFIPDEYINDSRQKIEFYKRYEACENPEEVENLRDEMTDRFGQPPEGVIILIEYEIIRTLASALRIEEIMQDSRSIRIKMTKQTEIDPARIVSCINTDSRFKPDPDDQEILIFTPSESSTEKIFQELKKWLQQIS